MRVRLCSRGHFEPESYVGQCLCDAAIEDSSVGIDPDRSTFIAEMFHCAFPVHSYEIDDYEAEQLEAIWRLGGHRGVKERMEQMNYEYAGEVEWEDETTR